MLNPVIRNGARGIVIRQDGKIAIFYKSNKKQYKLPGGGIENNETPEIAFKREVLEETGCNVEIIKKSYEIIISSKYSSVYSAKFVVLRDIRILEYYLVKEVN